MLNSAFPSAGLQGEDAGGRWGFGTSITGLGTARGAWGRCQGEGAEVGPGWGRLCHQKVALGWLEPVGSVQGPAPPARALESQTGEDQSKPGTSRVALGEPTSVAAFS